MKIIKGKGVCEGIAIGRLSFQKKAEPLVENIKATNIKDEILRYEKAKTQAVEQLGQLYQRALETVGEDGAKIFEIHQMMLEDEDFTLSVHENIQIQKANAAYAVQKSAEQFADTFLTLEDDYMRQRAADVQDVAHRVMDILNDRGPAAVLYKEPVIIAAVDLAPSQTVQLDRKNVLGFITEQGTTFSHTAILAKVMNIPAVVGVGEELGSHMDGTLAILDGGSGILYLDPDAGTLQKMQERQAAHTFQLQQLQQLKTLESRTQDGQLIQIFANVGGLADIDAVLESGAEGIGLFRTEFLYMHTDSFPSEEEQFQVYQAIVQRMHGKKTIIRTMDIGSDKQLEYFQLPREENPAMGFRAIRISLARPELFKTQLRAILRASACGNLSIMFPMIISVDEIERIKDVVEDVKQELRQCGIAFDEKMEMGIMIETPAAAIISMELAKHVDFFSIGTNDLTQYTLAIDRQNPRLESFYDAHHPAVLKMIEEVVKNAHEQGIWVGICGELAGDMSLTKTFLAMGVDELSVSPASVLELRKLIRSA